MYSKLEFGCILQGAQSNWGPSGGHCLEIYVHQPLGKVFFVVIYLGTSEQIPYFDSAAYGSAFILVGVGLKGNQSANHHFGGPLKADTLP